MKKKLSFDEYIEKLHTVDMTTKKAIALVDCDAFFVACEQSVNPELKGKPVCVISGEKGCVLSRSKEAKKMGVRMGMPYFMAKKEFPKAVYVNVTHDLYSEKSREVMSILKTFSPKVEVYSIDEAFIDLTGLERLYKKDYLELAKYIRKQVKEKTDISVSIGLSSSKTLAKLASDKAKKNPDGIYSIGYRQIQEELKNTDIGEIWGIGRNLTLMFHKNGIINAFELVSQSDAWINSKIGIRGLEMKHELLGQMVSEISDEFKMPKSIQYTSALGKFTSDINYLKNSLNYHIHRACVKLRRLDAKCFGVSIMLRTKDFKVYYEKKSLLNPTDFEMEVSDIIFDLLDKLYNPNILYRSTGVILDGITQNSEAQLSLFADNETNIKKENLGKAINKLEDKFGKNIIQTGFVKDQT